MRWPIAITLLAACGDNVQVGFQPMFNGADLDGWYSWLPSRGRNSDPLGVFEGAAVFQVRR